MTTFRIRTHDNSVRRPTRDTLISAEQMDPLDLGRVWTGLSVENRRAIVDAYEGGRTQDLIISAEGIKQPVAEHSWVSTGLQCDKYEGEDQRDLESLCKKIEEHFAQRRNGTTDSAALFGADDYARGRVLRAMRDACGAEADKVNKANREFWAQSQPTA
jgi:hypothetical protein